MRADKLRRETLSSSRVRCCAACPHWMQDGVCDEGRLCPALSDRVDCFCPTVADGVCDEGNTVGTMITRPKERGCALFSDYEDCSHQADQDADQHAEGMGGAPQGYCPPTYEQNQNCDAGELCPRHTDTAECKIYGRRPPAGEECRTTAGGDTCSDFYYCDTYSDYSYAKVCRPCTRSLDAKGGLHHHICSDFSSAHPASHDSSSACGVCERSAWRGCSHEEWQLRLYSPDGRGWHGNQYELNACVDAEQGECKRLEPGSRDSAHNVIAMGSPLAARVSATTAQGEYREVRGGSTQFTRSICTDWLEQIRHLRQYKAPATQCYRFTSWVTSHRTGGAQSAPNPAANDTQSLVPTATCHNIANQHLCYQGPAATIANVLKLDPFSCKPPKDSTVVNGTCAAAGYTDYKLNDPVFREAELWCKAGKHCLL